MNRFHVGIPTWKRFIVSNQSCLNVQSIIFNFKRLKVKQLSISRFLFSTTAAETTGTTDAYLGTESTGVRTKRGT